MLKVTGIIGILVFVLLSFGCTKSEKTGKYQLPETIQHRIPGKVNYITPRALIDSVNSGADMDIYFLREAIPDDPAQIVQIPGMKEVPIGDMFYIAETLSVEKPIYLVCLWGDDSKRMADRIAIDGVSSYYLHGGSYRLWKEMQENGWVFVRSTSEKSR